MERSLKKNLSLLAGEVIDATHMDVVALREFYAEQIEEAKKEFAANQEGGEESSGLEDINL